MYVNIKFIIFIFYICIFEGINILDEIILKKYYICIF